MCSAKRSCSAEMVSSTGARAPRGNASIKDGYAVDNNSPVYDVTKPSTLLAKNPVSNNASNTVSCDTSSFPTALPIRDGYAVDNNSPVYDVTKPSTLLAKNPVSNNASNTVSCDTSSFPTALPIDCAKRARCRGIIPCGQTVRPKIFLAR